MFISNLPLTARVALRAANEALTMHEPLVTQPEILFENLRRLNRKGNFFQAKYRPFGQDRKNDYEVRIMLERKFLKTEEESFAQYEIEGYAIVAHKGKISPSYPFRVTWSGIQNSPMVIFKRERGGGFPRF